MGEALRPALPDPEDAIDAACESEMSPSLRSKLLTVERTSSLIAVRDGCMNEGDDKT